MRTLIVVHVEPDFDLTGDLEILAKSIVRYSRTFHKVINITSCSVSSGYPNEFPIMENFTDNRDWIWGVYPDEDEPGTWRLGDNYIPTTGHQYSEILSWMRELAKDAHYTLVGEARWECLQDIYDIWNYLGYKTRIKEELTYG
jgi:hypothetical protein